MNRPEATAFLRDFFSGLANASPRAKAARPFLDFVLSLKRDLPIAIPLLRDLAAMGNERAAHETCGLLGGRMERRYARLCRLQDEMGRLDFKKAAPGVSPEDFIFSRIDFSRYREMGEKSFDLLFPEGLRDFDEAFLKKNFGLGREEIKSAIEGSYKKIEGVYKLQRENPLILSVMRTLETSTESAALFNRDEIQEELKSLLDFLGAGAGIKNQEKLFPLLVYSLDNVEFSHKDGMATRLFVTPDGGLSGTFRPGDKPWTCVLIPGEDSRSFR